jgi:5-methylcytosine-specific restriction endonuclease McrBC regulatory subunit McrC
MEFLTSPLPLMQPRETLLLTERNAAEFPLAGEDVDYLLTEHRTHLDLQPTRTPGLYRLTPRGHVGTLLTPHYRLHIRPKMPLANLAYLLENEMPNQFDEDRVEAITGALLPDMLALHLAELMSARAACGLHRDYRERQEQQAYLQGRLDVPAQMRLPPGRKDRLACRFEEHTVDVPVNQVPRAAAERLLACPLLGERPQLALQTALLPFRDVSTRPVEESQIGPEMLTPLTAAYGPLLDLCRIVLEGLTANHKSGAMSYPAFLLSLERIFEQYCTRHLVKELATRADGFSLQPQLACTPHRLQAGQPALVMRPDLMIVQNTRPVLVVDMKWKASPLVRTDLYQILAYCATLGCRRGLLIYPGGRDRTWDYQFEAGKVQVTIRQLRVIGAFAACRRSLDGLARRIEKWCHQAKEIGRR